MCLCGEEARRLPLLGGHLISFRDEGLTPPCDVFARRRLLLWRHCRNMDIPESLERRLKLFRETGRLFLGDAELFVDSWPQVMIGQGVMPEEYHAVVDTMDEDELKSFLRQIKSNIDNTVDKMPRHSDYLQKFCQS